MSHRFFIFLFIFAAVLRAPAGEETYIPEIGAHQPILVVEKNVRPQNIMVVYTKMNADGRFLPDPDNPGHPLLGFYWLMGRKDYKPVNPTIKAEIRKRFESRWVPGTRATHFVVNMNDLKEVNCDLKEPKVDVYAPAEAGARDVQVQMNLGPSDGNARIKLSSIYTDGRAFPPAVRSITLKGEEVVNGTPSGKKVERRYDAGGTQN